MLNCRRSSAARPLPPSFALDFFLFLSSSLNRIISYCHYVIGVLFLPVASLNLYVAADIILCEDLETLKSACVGLGLIFVPQSTMDLDQMSSGVPFFKAIKNQRRDPNLCRECRHVVKQIKEPTYQAKSQSILYHSYRDSSSVHVCAKNGCLLCGQILATIEKDHLSGSGHIGIRWVDERYNGADVDLQFGDGAGGLVVINIRLETGKC